MPRRAIVFLALQFFAVTLGSLNLVWIDGSQEMPTFLSIMFFFGACIACGITMIWLCLILLYRLSTQ
jgi:hypothetical protein